MLAPTPTNEDERLADLEDYRIVDTQPEESFDRIARLAGQVTQTPVALISLIDRDRQWFKSSIGIETSETAREMAFCAHAIMGDDVMVVEDATQDTRFADNPLVTAEGGIRFYAGAPLKSPNGHSLGTLCVIDRVPRRMEQRTREMLKDMAAMVVSELELRKAAGTDSLTGLFNRRFIDDLAQREMNRARRMKLPLTVALIDADQFKAVNDHHGHAAGDTVLRDLATCCRDSVRSHDMVGRYGGEEFLLLMPNTSAEQAETVLDRIRANVAAMPMPMLTDRLRLTVSIGASQVEERDANIAAAMTRADMALYRAKEKGRNRVAIDAAS
jgi:diguanylate cyclase (GGDEF)-like protein